VTGGQATGTSSPNLLAYHCGVGGAPVGDYFMAEYVEENADEAVTLLGCFEFCYASIPFLMGLSFTSFRY
jgi:hypothetical protein